MILTKKLLNEYQENTLRYISQEQQKRILEQLGTEPDGFEYSEQDIYEQLNKFLNRGYFFDPESC
jgi:hypothetical protein